MGVVDLNIRLVCTSNNKRGAFVIYKDGRVASKDSFSIPNKGNEAMLKEYVFESVIRGLRNVRGFVSHDDLLLIEVPNNHMAEWLNGSKEYKGYSKYLDEISDIIDTIDCRYMFAKSDVREAKKLLDEKISIKVEGVNSVFEGM